MAVLRSRLTGNSVWSSLVILGILAWSVQAAPPPGASPAAPMDLVPQGRDSNGLPLNPRWRHHLDTQQPPDPPQLPECKNGLQKPTCTTQQTSTDTVRRKLKVACKAVPGTIAGHLNYELATYSGRLTWHGWEPPFLDSDYGFALKRDDRAGMTAGSKDGVGLEFFSRETIERFRSPWWVTFRDAVKHASHDSPSGLVNGKLAIVSGLIGLDCVHGCDSEIHPALAMAIRVEEASNSEHWAVFAGSSGNEGFCSKGRYFMTTPGQQFVVLLPWKTGKQSVEVVNQTFYCTDRHAAAPRLIAVPDEGLALVFDLKALANLNTMDGELRVRWSDKVAAAGAGLAGFRTVAFRSGPEQERGVVPGPKATELSDDESLKGSSEEISRLLLRLSPEVRKAFISELKEKLPRYSIADDYLLQARPLDHMTRGQFTEYLHFKGRPQLTAAEDSEKAAYDEVLKGVLAKFERQLKSVK